jgi:hypothetical protein
MYQLSGLRDDKSRWRWQPRDGEQVPPLGHPQCISLGFGVPVKKTTTRVVLMTNPVAGGYLTNALPSQCRPWHVAEHHDEKGEAPTGCCPPAKRGPPQIHLCRLPRGEPEGEKRGLLDWTHLTHVRLQDAVPEPTIRTFVNESGGNCIFVSLIRNLCERSPHCQHRSSIPSFTRHRPDFHDESAVCRRQLQYCFSWPIFRQSRSM